MSTVLLTPTHIISDHSYLEKTSPSRFLTSFNHEKLFSPPDNSFIVGAVGSFCPKRINTPEVYDSLKRLLGSLITQQIAMGLIGNRGFLIDAKVSRSLRDVFDWEGNFIIATRRYRFSISQYEKNEDVLIGTQCGPYVGLGSGGPLAVGLALGKMKLPDLWSALHQLDSQTSLEFTSILLSSLARSTITLKEPFERHRL